MTEIEKAKDSLILYGNKNASRKNSTTIV